MRNFLFSKRLAATSFALNLRRMNQQQHQQQPQTPQRMKTVEKKKKSCSEEGVGYNNIISTELSGMSSRDIVR